MKSCVQGCPVTQPRPPSLPTAPFPRCSPEAEPTPMSDTHAHAHASTETAKTQTRAEAASLLPPQPRTTSTVKGWPCWAGSPGAPVLQGQRHQTPPAGVRAPGTAPRTTQAHPTRAPPPPHARSPAPTLTGARRSGARPAASLLRTRPRRAGPPRPQPRHPETQTRPGHAQPRGPPPRAALRPAPPCPSPAGRSGHGTGAGPGRGGSACGARGRQLLVTRPFSALGRAAWGPAAPDPAGQWHATAAPEHEAGPRLAGQISAANLEVCWSRSDIPGCPLLGSDGMDLGCLERPLGLKKGVCLAPGLFGSEVSGKGYCRDWGLRKGQSTWV